MDRSLATKEIPLLNRPEEYIPDADREDNDNYDITYDALGVMRKRTHMDFNKFREIYRCTMGYFSESEILSYKEYQRGNKNPKEFYRDCTNYLKKNFPEMKDNNDYKVMMQRIDYAIFGYDVLQPLIDDENTSDIKVCGYNDIRVRVKGDAYNSNASFIDNKDLSRFIEGILLRNHVNMKNYPMITFVDNRDPNYKLRFTITSPVVTSVNHAYLHIRKNSKHKANFDDLIKDGMLTPKIKNYLIDRAKASKAIVFAGPPGSGKTTALNAFIEYIPRTRETLVIQESDELFTEQTGFMFKHVSHGFQGELICTLEDLGKSALVEGCNEFIIGEVKGGEMRYAMTLVNAGGHAALTVHSTNAYETQNKLADLVKYGSTYSFDEARQMLTSFDTIVYMEGYKIREILECTGYDYKTKQFSYINIYRYNNEKREEKE